ncbi:hypothetical protein Bpfe_009592 [Biomphalaria pfeifferi]|uniref:Uncharacterized protein n=1 Tax=Biomphalaria pfeifferi TaxID=112525 RepID=A0AAD8BUF4_BIOPF|nr:hypothetical protein Bpfe_009592 [Biomphalaria pfeifferi]
MCGGLSLPIRLIPNIAGELQPSSHLISFLRVKMDLLTPKSLCLTQQDEVLTGIFTLQMRTPLSSEGRHDRRGRGVWRAFWTGPEREFRCNSE